MITHSGEKKYLCQSCGFATSHSSVFKSHQRIHTGQTIKCGLPGCHFETVRKHNLVQHQITHSKEKPHQCEICGKSFSLVKNMRRHMLMHNFTAKRHTCCVEGCSFSSLRRDKFLEHQKRHQEQLQVKSLSDKTVSPSLVVVTEPDNVPVRSDSSFVGASFCDVSLVPQSEDILSINNVGDNKSIP